MRLAVFSFIVDLFRPKQCHKQWLGYHCHHEPGECGEWTR
jgi:hypothetical protein